MSPWCCKRILNFDSSRPKLRSEAKTSVPAVIPNLASNVRAAKYCQIRAGGTAEPQLAAALTHKPCGPVREQSRVRQHVATGAGPARACRGRHGGVLA